MHALQVPVTRIKIQEAVSTPMLYRVREGTVQLLGQGRGSTDIRKSIVSTVNAWTLILLFHQQEAKLTLRTGEKQTFSSITVTSTNEQVKASKPASSNS